jgi:hypothetical protein
MQIHNVGGIELLCDNASEGTNYLPDCLAAANFSRLRRRRRNNDLFRDMGKTFSTKEK